VPLRISGFAVADHSLKFPATATDFAAVLANVNRTPPGVSTGTCSTIRAAHDALTLAATRAAWKARRIDERITPAD